MVAASATAVDAVAVVAAVAAADDSDDDVDNDNGFRFKEITMYALTPSSLFLTSSSVWHHLQIKCFCSASSPMINHATSDVGAHQAQLRFWPDSSNHLTQVMTSPAGACVPLMLVLDNAND